MLTAPFEPPHVLLPKASERRVPGGAAPAFSTMPIVAGDLYKLKLWRESRQEAPPGILV
jgi:hypothetical protein